MTTIVNRLPIPWNVGPITSDNDPVITQSEIRVYREYNEEVHRETGIKGPVALVYHDSKLVGVLKPADLLQILGELLK